jgi:hypothetical protein
MSLLPFARTTVRVTELVDIVISGIVLAGLIGLLVYVLATKVRSNVSLVLLLLSMLLSTAAFFS